MDMRGVAELGNGQYLIAGGMLANQQVTDQLLHITIDDLTFLPTTLASGQTVTYFPNPTRDLLKLKFSDGSKESFSWTLFDNQGHVLRQGKENGTANWRLSLRSLPVANYWLQLIWSDGSGRVLSISKQ